MKKFIAFILLLSFTGCSLTVFANGEETLSTIENNNIQAEEILTEDTESKLTEAFQKTIELGTLDEPALIEEDIINRTSNENDREIKYISTISPEEAQEIWCQTDRNTASLTDEEILSSNSIMTYSEDFSGWLSCGTMISARSYMSSVAVEENIYTFGGSESGKIVNNTEMYNTTTEVWTRKAIMPRARYKHTAIAIGDKVYICGGYDATDNPIDIIDVYNVKKNTWEAPIDTPNNNTNYTAVEYNGEIYIISGLENGENSQKVYTYNVEQNSWNNITSIDKVFIDAKSGIQDNNIVVFDGENMYFYDASNNFAYIHKRELERNVVDYAVISRNFLISSLYPALNLSGSSVAGFFLTGGRSSDSEISTAAVTAYYPGDYSADISSWNYDLRLIRGLSCHNMVEANGCIYIFGGQVVKGTDQKLMFKRSIRDMVDDVPETAALQNGTVVGSINGNGDSDSFTITPQKTSLYSFRLYSYWEGLQFTLSRGNVNLGYFYDQGGVDKYVYGFERLLDAGVTYTIDVYVPQSYDSQCGTYAFAYVPVDDDVPNLLGEAYDINIGSTYYKKIEAIDDIDCFKFDIEDWGEYYIPFNVSGDGVEYSNYQLEILDDYKNKLYSLNNGNDTSLNSVTLKPGQYYLKITGNSAADYNFKISNTGTIQKLQTGRMKHEMTVADGKLYVLGGLNSKFNSIYDAEYYNSNNSMWYKTGSISDLRKGFSVASYGQDIYIIGGYRNNNYYNTIKTYNTETKELSNIGSIETARERAGTAVKDGKIYIIGGRSENGYIDNIEVFDTNTKETINTIILPEALIDVQAFFKDDVLYIIGGTGYNGYSDKVYAYENNQWSEKVSMPYVSEYMRGNSYNGNFFCAAVNIAGNVDLLKYDTSENEWSILRNNFIEKLIYYAFDVMDGYLYVTGGYSYNENKAVDSVYTYDCVTDISTIDRTIPIRSIGFEYEQAIEVSGNLQKPEIKGVTAKKISPQEGIYQLTVDDYTSDPRSVPFFFWSSREGVFSGISSDYRTVMFYADPGTGDREVKVVVGIGDGRGYSDKKSFNLPGNNNEK